MFPVFYLPYLFFLGWALLRARREAVEAGRLPEWRLMAAAMVFAPVAVGIAVAVAAQETESATVLLTTFYVPGAAMLAGGLLPAPLPSSWRLALRVVGWSLIAGITLVPSWLLVFFVPLAGAMAFFVPGGYLTPRRAAMGPIGR